MTMAELERWLALEILGRYHQSVHSALSMPPIAAWEKGMRARGTLRQVQDPRHFFCEFLPGEHRLIRRDKIRLFNIHYWSNVLTPLAGKSQKPALVKYNPRNLSRTISATITVSIGTFHIAISGCPRSHFGSIKLQQNNCEPKAGGPSTKKCCLKS